PSFGVQVGQDLAAQLGFGREHHLLGNPVAFAPVGVGGLLAGQIRAGADQCVSGRGSETAVHDVDGGGDPAGAADVLAFDPDGSGALLLLPGLVQDRDRVAVVQPLADQRPDRAIAPMVSHLAAFSRCCILPGVASPACSAMLQQFLRGRSLINARTYLRAWTRGSHLRKHPAIKPINSSRWLRTAPTSTVAAAAAHDSSCVTTRRSSGGCPALRTGRYPLRSRSRTAVLGVVSFGCSR